MSEKFVNKKTIIIYAPVADVWQALTNSRMIKQYFLGVRMITDWKEGSNIISKGKWEGKEFEGKGKVMQVETQKLLTYSYWSNISGLPNIPENYHIITYELAGENEITKLTLTEENLATKEMKDRSGKLWDIIFNNLKKLLEKQEIKELE
jgi:uncharacterized protein YndB with AHSA1/START domain